MTETIPLPTADGHELRLTRSARPGARGAAWLLHGLTSSSEIFSLPSGGGLAAALLEAGWEVWALDWRGSCRLPYNARGARSTIDDVADQDLPAALAAIRARTDLPVVAIAHCVGALALAAAIGAGTVRDLRAVVSNAVFLAPTLPPAQQARVLLPELGGWLLARDHVEIEPSRMPWRDRLWFPLATAASHRCGHGTCELLAGLWGPLFEHANVDPVTHARIGEWMGPVPLRGFLPHLRRMAAERAVVRATGPGRAEDALDRFAAPTLLVAGTENRVWGRSQEACASWLAERGLPATYLPVPGYGHLDVLVGRNAAVDVFPAVIGWLEQVGVGSVR